MGYQAPATPRNPEEVSRQMTSDPRVQQAYSRYRDTRNQADFVAYLDAIQPYTSLIDQNRYGIDPETGLFRGTSNYGHWWKLGAGMAAGAAAPYGPWANGASSGANKASSYVGDDMYDATGGGGQDWWKVARSVLPAVAPMIGRAVTGGSGSDPASSSAQIPPELSELLKLQTQRIQQSQPNYETMLRMVSGMMPRWARNGASPGAAPSMDPSMAAIIQRMAVPR